ncbi:hypothetical protein BDY21DRAFT_345249, partial [Lineolata rhizophorae]
MLRPVVLRRAELLRNWSTAELADIADVHAVLRDVVHSNVCPSNGTIARKFRKRFPDPDGAAAVAASSQLLFNIHLNYPPEPGPGPVAPASSVFHNPNALANHYHATLPAHAVAAKSRASKFRASPFHEPGAEGWGDDIPHYYVVEDMMKLDPEQILWLKENAPRKVQVERYVRALGDWFENNGETWGQTLEWVLDERGEDVADVLAAVAEGEAGVALVD